MLAAVLSPAALAATITVTLTGRTGEIRVLEGPIFGHKSYTLIPAGDPFVLTFVFDEDTGKQSIEGVSGALITQSEIANTALSSPGVSAMLQIGSAVWEFGPSTHAQVVLKTTSGGQGEQFIYATRAGSNRVMAQIVPGKSAYWPKNGDWRASFTSTTIDKSTASFAADNDRVAAAGSLIPSAIAVSGVDIDGQWLRVETTAGGGRRWQLAHSSPQGGYIVEEVIQTIRGTMPDGSPIAPSFVKYWQAWQVTAGSDTPQEKVSGFEDKMPSGGTGEESVSAVARFYEGVRLPPVFAVGNSPYAASRLSSMTDPHLSTERATLPVTTETKLQLGNSPSVLR